MDEIKRNIKKTFEGLPKIKFNLELPARPGITPSPPCKY